MDRKVQELREQREMADKLLITARKLPPGPNRLNAIQLIGQFRLQIAAFRCPELGRPAQNQQLREPEPSISVRSERALQC